MVLRRTGAHFVRRYGYQLPTVGSMPRVARRVKVVAAPPSDTRIHSGPLRRAGGVVR